MVDPVIAAMMAIIWSWSVQIAVVFSFRISFDQDPDSELDEELDEEEEEESQHWVASVESSK